MRLTLNFVFLISADQSKLVELAQYYFSPPKSSVSSSSGLKSKINENGKGEVKKGK